MPRGWLCSHRRSFRQAVIVAGWALVLASTGVSWAQPGPVTHEQGLEAWGGIAKVLQHPRCLNCHQGEAPLRGDAREPHVPRVARGPDDHGVAGLRCYSCHSLSGNDPTSGVPGAPHWSLARVTMNWQGLDSGDLCRALKDRKRNGNRSLDALIEHFERDELLLWSWNPGKNRAPIPMPHQEFMDLVRTWAASGAACPA